MDKQTPITLDIGNDLLEVADSLVDTKNTKALGALSHVLPQMILANITDARLSLIELQDYINDAISSFERGMSPSEVKLLTIRKFLELSPVPQSEQFKILDQNINPEITRRHFVDFLSGLLPTFKSGELPPPQIAYSIAGMLSSDFAQTLGDDDPLMEIMTIAGELEVAPKDTPELTKELIQKIEALSK